MPFLPHACLSSLAFLDVYLSSPTFLFIGLILFAGWSVLFPLAPLINNSPSNIVNEMCLVQSARRLVSKWHHSGAEGGIRVNKRIFIKKSHDTSSFDFETTTVDSLKWQYLSIPPILCFLVTLDSYTCKGKEYGLVLSCFYVFPTASNVKQRETKSGGRWGTVVRRQLWVVMLWLWPCCINKDMQKYNKSSARWAVT